LDIGLASCHLGRGKVKKTDVIDVSADIILNKKVGVQVKKGELLFTLHTNKDDVESIIKNIKEAFIIQDEPFIESELMKIESQTKRKLYI
jgi:pyrimidine-nucleoside phosphorylase